MNKFLDEQPKSHFSNCENCINYIELIKCKAFKTIPDDILFNEIKHDKVIKGQEGDYVFEEIK